MHPQAPEQLSIFLVEDSPADVFLVQEVMREEGLCCVLQIADDGEKAIQMIDRLDQASDAVAPNLALLDMNVPRMNGTEVLQRIRQSPRCGHIPVVMISSSASPKDRQLALGLGATEYFRKPSNLTDFMELGKLVRRLHNRSGSAA